eukprot:TRINITY_DN2825_c0_g1_i7.p1 TRINITY_DN2825_c0_g1~~TRINITY_DN2825_c0_g1_i7.p1  ORF type:complete len:162 (-),score=25.14 TRINITY_DN2825_c0_g1_i7:49-534(-)
MTTVPNLHPISCHDRQCPYNVWLYCGGPFPSPLEVQYWDLTYGTKRKDQSDKQEEHKSEHKDCKISKLSCIKWSRSTVSRSSSNSSLSSCYTDIRLPVDPYAPHAFTVNKTERHTNKTRQEIHQPTCVLLSFLVSSVVSLTVVLIYLSQATQVMTSGMGES